MAASDNFDYAISLYLDGLHYCPDALEDGHAPLRRLALIRQGKGGGKPSMLERVKHLKGKLPVDEMLNAEFLLAKNPDNLQYAAAMLKAAVAAGCTRTAEWIAQLLFDANRAGSKPSFNTYVLLKDAYSKLGLFTQAVAACQHALELKPNDDALRDQLRDLSANMTMEKGKYGKASDFRQSIKDRDYQDNLHSQDQVVKSKAVLEHAVSQARKQLQQAPDSPTNIIQLADALAKLGSNENFSQALSLLQNAYDTSRNFLFKRHIGELTLKHLKQQIRSVQNLPPSAETDGRAATLISELDRTELEHYRLCVENYPTDLKYKYELGRCLLKRQMYDQAIPLFQEATNDPRISMAAMDKTGLCFLLKGWCEDAIDIFNRALKSCPVENDIAKDIRYNLARAYEAANQPAAALEIYRKLAQADFGYKDISQRIDKLRPSGHNS